jgi:hypothetical protein
MPRKSKVPAKNPEFDLAFQGVRKIFRPYDKKLRVVKDLPGGYMSESKSVRYLGKPLMFAAITSKSYVSLHLFPVYMFPDLLQGMSSALKKRMQGKTCWNFSKPDEPLFAELGELVKASFRRFVGLGECNLTREDAQALWGKAQKKSAKKKS